MLWNEVGQLAIMDRIRNVLILDGFGNCLSRAQRFFLLQCNKLLVDLHD